MVLEATSINVDSETWKKVKIQAITNDELIQEFVDRALKAELERSTKK